MEEEINQTIVNSTIESEKIHIPELNLTATIPEIEDGSFSNTYLIIIATIVIFLLYKFCKLKFFIINSF